MDPSAIGACSVMWVDDWFLDALDLVGRSTAAGGR
jgi:hypothetical protein